MNDQCPVLRSNDQDFTSLFGCAIFFGGVHAFTKDQDQFLTSFLLGIGHGYWELDIGYLKSKNTQYPVFNNQ
jgi:hypothetical protein